MTERLYSLLDAVWEHALPLGPLGELESREQSERAWEESLSAEDCLILLAWIKKPQRPPHWEPIREKWLQELVDSAASHIGRAGRRIGDPRITNRIVSLLALDQCRSPALESLIELRDSSSFDALISYLGDQQNRLNLTVAIASVATSLQIEKLRKMASSSNFPTEWCTAAAECVAEWEEVR